MQNANSNPNRLTNIPPLSPEDIAEFRRMVREETGYVMTDQEAWDRALELISLVRMLIGPIPEDEDAPEEFPRLGSSKGVPARNHISVEAITRDRGKGKPKTQLHIPF